MGEGVSSARVIARLIAPKQTRATSPNPPPRSPRRRGSSGSIPSGVKGSGSPPSRGKRDVGDGAAPMLRQVHPHPHPEPVEGRATSPHPPPRSPRRRGSRGSITSCVKGSRSPPSRGKRDVGDGDQDRPRPSIDSYDCKCLNYTLAEPVVLLCPLSANRFFNVGGTHDCES